MSKLTWASGLAMMVMLSAPGLQALTPQEAIQNAIQGNPRFAEVGLAVDEAAMQVRAQQSIRPFTLSANGGFNFDEQPTSGVIEDGIRTSNFLSLSTALAKQLVYGTQMSLQFDFNRSQAEVPFNVPQFNISETRTIGPNYGNLLQFSVSQPILRGFGRDLNDLPLAIARQNQTVAELQRLRTAHDLTAEVLNAYWSWVRAAREVETVEASLQRSKTIAELTVAQIEAGQLAELQRDIVAQRIASSEQTLLLARSAAVDAWQSLQKIMGVDYGETIPEPPQQLPESPGTIPPAEALLETALETNPDIELLDQDIKANKLQLRRSANDVKPQLDAIGRISQSSLAQDVPTAFEQIATLELTSFFIGLNFVMPLDNGLAESTHDANQIAVERAKVRKTQAVREVEQLVRQARRVLVTQRERLALSNDEVKLARKNLTALQDKYSAGLASYLEVLEQETALEDAELRNSQSAVDLLQAEASLRRITGTLLDSYDVTVEGVNED